jgi:hypothetical protein
VWLFTTASWHSHLRASMSAALSSPEHESVEAQQADQADERSHQPRGPLLQQAHLLAAKANSISRSSERKLKKFTCTTTSRSVRADRHAYTLLVQRPHRPSSLPRCPLVLQGGRCGHTCDHSAQPNQPHQDLE